ncbi:MAG: DUF4214 domain-containing protein [Alphaproteobacteria bacterium]|nr:DUF4214 domain-containing protein [Alphaproteobacteria bacterium]MBU2380023.1 DUF4214 domain-containing protein [Alphaproteobacteria bacterium]
MPYFNGTQGADVLAGSDQADTLVPYDGADVVNAGAGDDRIEIVEDGAPDVFTGGAGADLYTHSDRGYLRVFGAHDRITDFNIAEGDRIEFFPGESGGSTGYRRWAGAITDPTFSLTLGAALPPGDSSSGEFWTWQSGGITYLITDGGTHGVIDVRDFILAFDGLIDLSPAAFAARTFLAQSGTVGNDTWTGGAAGEIYQALIGDDVADGGGGDDEIRGGLGADQLNGGDGADLLVGDEGSDVLRGGAGNDRLYAAFQYNTTRTDDGTTNSLFGDDGDDALIGGSGADFLDGGAGNDVLSSSADLAGAAQDTLFGGAGNDILRLNRDIGDGGDGDDTLTLGSIASRATGGSGADRFTVTGYQANYGSAAYSLITDFNVTEGDQLDLGGRVSRPVVLRGALDNATFTLTTGARFSGEDYGSGFIQIWTWANGGDTHLIIDLDSDGVLSAGDFLLRLSGAPVLSEAAFTNVTFTALPGATMGADVIIGTEGTDTLYGLGGDDRIEGRGGNYDQLYGGEGNDLLIAGPDGARLYGDAGNDRLEGGAGWDTLIGGSGSDVLYGGGGNDNLHGTDISTLAGTDAPDDVNVIYGGAGNDRITGGAPNDRLYGEDGDDSIYGAGFMDGGAGSDNLHAGTGRGYLMGGEGDDYIRGGSFNDFLMGGAGFDNAQGNFGDDVIVLDRGDLAAQGSFGDDLIILDSFDQSQDNSLQIYGQEGIDTLDLGLADRLVTVDLRSTQEQNIGGGVRLTLGTIENVRAGDFGSSLIGTSGANRLIGGRGNDVLNGGWGDDRLEGGSGFDTAVFAYERAVYTITSEDGLIIVEGPEGRDVLSGVQRLQFSDMTIDGAADTVIAGNVVAGTTGIDVLQGSDYNDRLDGGMDNDALIGGAGADMLIGGGGDDILVGGSGVDTAVYGGIRRQYVATSTSVQGAADGADTLTGIENLSFVDGVLTFDATSAWAQVMRLYSATLNRAPDQGGLEAQVGALEVVGLQGLASNFVASAEFQARFGALNNQQFVEQLYVFALGRTGDPAGISGWVNFLNNGMTRGQVVVGFSESPENQLHTAATLAAGLWIPHPEAQIIARLYDATFDRLPDTAGLAGWVGILDAGTASLQQIAAAFAGSAEFQQRYGALSNQQFVEQLYRFCLNREGDPAGISGWVTVIDNGMSRAEVLLGFSESPEHVALTAPLWSGGIRYHGYSGAPLEDAGTKGLDEALVLPGIDDATSNDPADLGLLLQTKDDDAFVLPADPDGDVLLWVLIEDGPTPMGEVVLPTFDDGASMWAVPAHLLPDEMWMPFVRDDLDLAWA